MMSHNNCILRSLNLTDKNIKFSADSWNRHEFRGKGRNRHKALIYDGVLTYKVTRCSNCGFNGSIRNYGFTTTECKLISTNDFDVRLRLKKQRFQCKNCNATSVAHTPDIPTNCNISRQIRQHVLMQAKSDMSEKLISKSMSISANSVSRIINAESNRYYYQFGKGLPEHLCFDEIRTAHSRMSFLYCDSDSHKLIDILPDRTLNTIRKYFSGFSLAARLQVKHVVIDMNANYSSVVRELFPNAKIVIDRFHTVQLAGRALDAVRIHCIRKLSADKRSREYKILKSHWRLLHKYSANLERQKRRYLYGLNEYMTQAEAIYLIFNKFPNLEKIWNIYQQILAAIRTRNVLLLADVFNIETKDLPDEAVILIKTLKKNIKGISESCESPYSNGPLEGLNRKIKQISRSGYGYRNLANFFNRIRLELA